MTEVADKTTAEEAQEIFRRRPIGDKVGGRFRYFPNKIIRVDVMSEENSVSVSDFLQNGYPRFFSVLNLGKKEIELCKISFISFFLFLFI